MRIIKSVGKYGGFIRVNTTPVGVQVGYTITSVSLGMSVVYFEVENLFDIEFDLLFLYVTISVSLPEK